MNNEYRIMMKTNRCRPLFNPQLEAGSGLRLGHERQHTCLEDILVERWGVHGKAAAFNLSVSSLLKPDIISSASHTARSAVAIKEWKIQSNGLIYDELGLICAPLVVETFGAWGQIAQHNDQEMLRSLHVIGKFNSDTMLIP